MARPASRPLRSCALACGLAVSIGLFSLTARGESPAAGEPPLPEAPATADGAPPFYRMANAPAGSAVEAVPEVPIPPELESPRRPIADMPATAESAVSLKKATARFTLLGGGGNEIGMDMVDGEAMFSFRDLPNLTAGPSGGVLFLDGPIRTDLPPRLYTAQFDFRWFGQVATPVFYELAFMPAIFTDGENVGSDALRLQARGVGYLAFSEQTQLVLGLTYLDREDFPVLPVVGVIHSPRDDLKLELVFPKPRVLKRVAVAPDAETWAYVVGELGGGSWAIERQNGQDDIANYRDYRLLFGLERKRTDRWTAAIEAGYVFERELEYERGRGDFGPDNTVLLRLALSH